MCGIAGERRFDGRSADIGLIARMNDCHAPRGPDGLGVQVHGPVGLGHRRLKIMDRSDLSQQPMIDPALGLSIVFNGAIYNHPELRAELSGLGYRFYSEGDTEVLLKAYDCWGLDFVDHLQGMFAFAIFERDSGRMVLGRDRAGGASGAGPCHCRQRRLAADAGALPEGGQRAQLRHRRRGDE